MLFMGWQIIFETENISGFKSGSNGDLWFVKANHNQNTNYDAKGVNHISLRVSELSDVDRVKGYLGEKRVNMLFETPKHRPEFVTSENETYYQIMFESPDKILFEVVYIGLK